jgi:hypothetical protein
MRTHKAVLLLFLCSIFAASAFAQTGDARALESEVVWSSAERTSALFVPAETFKNGIETSPLSELDRAFIGKRITESKQSHRCAGIELAHRFEVAPDQRRTLTRVIDDAPAVMVGRVVAVVKGWSSWSMQPAMLVWLAPERVVHDRNGILAGDSKLVAFPIHEAELRFGDARLCSTAPGMIIPRIGDRVLLDVDSRIGDGRMLSVAHYFPVVDDVIQPQGFADMVPFRAMSLERAGVQR